MTILNTVLAKLMHKNIVLHIAINIKHVINEENEIT